jgi:uncharacterized membrane protein YbjE (DUF340 family)
MLTVVLIMMAGIVLGYFLRTRKRLAAINDKFITYAIYLLLLLLGISIGSNKTIVANLPVLGVKALIVTIGAMVGSILLALLTYNLFFKNRN